MVTVARLLNLTLVIPELDKQSFWADPRYFFFGNKQLTTFHIQVYASQPLASAMHGWAVPFTSSRWYIWPQHHRPIWYSIAFDTTSTCIYMPVWYHALMYWLWLALWSTIKILILCFLSFLSAVLNIYIFLLQQFWWSIWCETFHRFFKRWSTHH